MKLIVNNFFYRIVWYKKPRLDEATWVCRKEWKTNDAILYYTL